MKPLSIFLICLTFAGLGLGVIYHKLNYGGFVEVSNPQPENIQCLNPNFYLTIREHTITPILSDLFVEKLKGCI